MHPLETLVLRLVPERWREDVVRDLVDERPRDAGSAWFLLRALEIGTRLRLMQAADAIHDLPRQRWRSPMRDVISDIRLGRQRLVGT